MDWRINMLHDIYVKLMSLYVQVMRKIAIIEVD